MRKCPLCEQEILSRVKRCVYACITIPILIFISWIIAESIFQYIDSRLSHSYVCTEKINKGKIK
jgi:hypothetical protein